MGGGGIDTNYIDIPDSISETLMQNGNEIVGSVNENDDKDSEEEFLIIFGDTTEAETTATTTTTSTTMMTPSTTESTTVNTITSTIITSTMKSTTLDLTIPPISMTFFLTLVFFIQIHFSFYRILCCSKTL